MPVRNSTTVLDTPHLPTDLAPQLEPSGISKLAQTPPMGWNSWDAFGVSVTEDEIRENARFVAEQLLPYGWKYVVVDLGWFSPSATRDNYKLPGLEQLIDEYGRLIPDPKKFPSSAGGRGFAPLADFIHELGLEFGIHIMRGLPWQAVEQNTRIKGSQASARSISQPLDPCLWYANTCGINMTRPGSQEYYNSVAELFAEWDVDFVKADDMNSWDGDGLRAPYHTDEIAALRKAIDRTGHPMVLSLSPGAAEVANAQHLREHANMWRVSCDFWDDWAALKRQFLRCAKWAPYSSAGHWPDADMMPLGKIAIRGDVGESRFTLFSQAEQRTLMTLWCIFRSPLMFGGHLPDSDDFAISLITNRELLAVNQLGANPRELEFEEDGYAIWLSQAPKGGKYVAMFNLSEEPRQVSVPFKRLGFGADFLARDLWNSKDKPSLDTHLTCKLPPHDAAMYLVRGTPSYPVELSQPADGKHVFEK